jgi:hypothetical protein
MDPGFGDEHPFDARSPVVSTADVQSQWLGVFQDEAGDLVIKVSYSRSIYVLAREGECEPTTDKALVQEINLVRLY